MSSRAIEPYTPRQRSRSKAEKPGELSRRRRATRARSIQKSRTADKSISVRQALGIALMSAFIIFYLANFYAVASQTRSEKEDEGPSNDKARLPVEKSSSEPAALSIKSVNVLPGAISIDSKSFEHTEDDTRASIRDPNMLPGAPLLDMKFDNFVSQSRLPGAEKSEPGSFSPNTQKKDKNFNGDSQKSSGENPSGKPDEESDNRLSRSKPDQGSSSLPAKSMKKRKRKKKRKQQEFTSSDSQGSGSEKADSQRKNSKASADTGKQNATLSTKKSKSKVEEASPLPPVDTGPHPMSRAMSELQVEGDAGTLDASAIKQKYTALVKAYLAPFAKGIKRSALFSIMKRKNYSLAPPNSNKGIQTLLFQIVQKRVYMLDPYEVAKHSKPFYRSRINEMIWLLGHVANEGNIPDTEFLVAIHDCVQTVSRDHTYRGAHFLESSPTFTIVACNFSDNIPFPMWEGDAQRGGGLNGWDDKMKEYEASDKTPWEEKIPKAVFRGGNKASMYFAEKKHASDHCDSVGRSRLQYLGMEHSELYDVSISGACGDKTYEMTRLSETDHHKYKYILYAEGNCFWADRLNKQVFGPSAILKQETPCGQFWEPLLRPMTHYIPTDFFFSDTTERIKWGNEHGGEVQKIVKNANDFAHNFLSLNGIKIYVEVLLSEYTALLETKEIKAESGADDVTDAKL